MLKPLSLKIIKIRQMLRVISESNKGIKNMKSRFMATANSPFAIAPAPVGAPEFLADKIGFKPAFLRSAISRVCAVLDISVCQAARPLPTYGVPGGMSNF
jgi:hypothetical protein